ncbi:hypothetical protein ACLB1Q_29680 [Escherichia coli]
MGSGSYNENKSSKTYGSDQLIIL